MPEPSDFTQSWNQLIALLPGAHLLQTWEWGQMKAAYGWAMHPIVWLRTNQGYELSGYTQSTNPSQVAAAALVLERTIPIGGFAARLRLQYAPKGPLLNWGDAPLRRQVLDDLRAFAHQRGAIFLKIDPDVVLGKGIPGAPEAIEDPLGRAVQDELQTRGWRLSDEQIQFRNTVLLDLTPNEATLLGQMKQKTRYNIRLAERKGVDVRVGEAADISLLYRMYAETSLRDGFVIRDEAYYRAVIEAFSGPRGAEQPVVEPLIADVEGEPVAAVVIFRFAGRAWYLYGMSREAQRDKMPNYLLQWEAMRRARAASCTVYDLWGAPDEFNERDPMWGVFRFKEGLGGVVTRSLGAWDLPIRPMVYRLYTQILPRILDVMRRRSKAKTRASVNLVG